MFFVVAGKETGIFFILFMDKIVAALNIGRVTIVRILVLWKKNEGELEEETV